MNDRFSALVLLTIICGLLPAGRSFATPTENLGDAFRIPDRVHFNQLGLDTFADRWYAVIYMRYFAEVPLGPRKKAK